MILHHNGVVVITLGDSALVTTMHVIARIPFALCVVFVLYLCFGRGWK